MNKETAKEVRTLYVKLCNDRISDIRADMICFAIEEALEEEPEEIFNNHKKDD